MDKNLHFQDLAHILSGENCQIPQPENALIYLLFDSRKTSLAKNSLFFALKGENHDGHDFIEEVYQKGGRNFIIEEFKNEYKGFDEANFLRVPQGIKALQQLALHHRKQFQIPRIGITGSNGKTILKEWLAHLLMRDYRVFKSPQSYNSQIGVALSLWEINSVHQLAILEAGISRSGEMAQLSPLIEPQGGIFSNLGSAHDEGFESREEKLEEKLLLFSSAEWLCFRAHKKEINRMIQSQLKKTELLAWVFDTDPPPKDLDYVLVKLHQSPRPNLEIVHSTPSKNLVLNLPSRVLDPASLENITQVILSAQHLNIAPSRIQEQLNNLPTLAMRLEWKPALNDSYLMNDAYNNDLAGLRAALDTLAAHAHKKYKVLILSDILESGLPEAELYGKVNDLLQGKIDELIVIGKAIQYLKEIFPGKCTHFPDTQSFLASRHWESFQNADLLLKGAREFRFEEIARKLEQKSHGTVLEINLEALVDNLNFYRSQLSSSTKLMVMVKAFAYGSGIWEVASLLQFQRVDYLAVAYADEGVYLRQNGIQVPIMVMNPGDDSWEKILDYDLEPEIYNFRTLSQYLRAYKNFQSQGRSAKIHLKIDTGMHRLGFQDFEIEALLSRLQEELPWEVELASVFSHLAGADESAHEEYSRQQIKLFQEICNQIEHKLGYRFIRHILNSPGIIRFPEAQLDMVRLGIGLYGIEANGQQSQQLKAIGTLKSHISQIKYLEAGETIGYGRKGQVHRPSRVATIAIGYADGFSRQLSQGQGKVWIKGKAAPVIGNICMDMSMIDLGDMDAEEGDEVIIFSPEHPIQELADQLKTIPYEVLTMVSERVKRVFYT